MVEIDEKQKTQGPAPTHDEIEQEKKQQMEEFREILQILTESETDNVEKKSDERPDRHHWARGV